MLLKNFACGRLSFLYFTPRYITIYITIYHYISLLYFNFVHDSISYLCTTVTNAVKKNFACGGLSSLLYFNFVEGFIIFLCTIVKMLLKNFSCGGLLFFLHFHFAQDFFAY